MNRAIFIHPRASFLERIKAESGEKAITTTSMLDALKWITNPIHHLSAVYLNPDDTSFSALHFIELSLNHRPTLPIFLLEGKLAQNKSDVDYVTGNSHIRGVFSGSESYETLTAALKSHMPLDTSKPRPAPIKSVQPGYVTVPVSDFFTGSTYPFDVFINTEEGDTRLFAPKDSAIDGAYLNNLVKKTSWFLVRDEDIKKTREKIQTLKSTIADDPKIPASWRSSEVMVSAKVLMDEMKKAGVSDTMVQHTQTMLGDLYHLISKLDSDDEGSLFDIIDRAKKCNRAIFCSSYSILLCKQMRYERAATLEILGFASILQDVALYQTPFGDLSEKKVEAMTPDEFQFYQKHPVLSSDMVAQHTDMPQVTLQVIRQQHERKNKTGFPNKVGGSQLHTMSEILSLINTYYEVSTAPFSQAEMVQHMNRNVFPNFSENIVLSFKQVLGNILKDKILAAHAEQTSA